METKKNIISWYPFEKGCTILEIKSEYNQITDELKHNSDKIVSININELQNINEKFDYITLIGLEDITDNIQDLFNKLKTLLNKNGKILLAMNNKYSVKNLSTKEGIDKIIGNSNKIFTLNEVEKSLETAGFKKKKLYYPLTDYKFTNVIFTDDNKISTF